MIKNREATDPTSCWNKAKDDEMVFVLLGRDAAAPQTIRMWANSRIRLGKNEPHDPQIAEALECADEMARRQWSAVAAVLSGYSEKVMNHIGDGIVGRAAWEEHENRPRWSDLKERNKRSLAEMCLAVVNVQTPDAERDRACDAIREILAGGPWCEQCGRPGTFDGFAVECEEHRIPMWENDD